MYQLLDTTVTAQPHLLKTIQHSKQIQTFANMTTIRNALDRYHAFFYHFPINTSISAGLPAKFPVFSSYYHYRNQDAWGMRYRYITDPQGYSYTLTSYGQNRIIGGGKSSFDEDIVMVSGSLITPEHLTNPCRDFQFTTARMRAIGTALGSYQVDYNVFPNASSIVSIDQKIISRAYYAGPYTDAWGMPFTYLTYRGQYGQEYELKSFGKDKAAGNGSSEFDADIIFTNGMLLSETPPSCPINPESAFKRTQADMRALGTALGSYQVDYNVYPAFSPAVNLCDTPIFDPAYYRGSCRDGWNTPYQYISSPDSYTLTSFGKDRKPGYTDNEYDKDIIHSNGSFIAP